MKLRFTIILILSLPCVSRAFGGTAVIDLARWDGISDLPDGWTQEGLSHSATDGDYKGGAQFASVSGDWLRSPRMGYVIVSVKAEVAYYIGEGKTLTRVLTLRPVVDGTNAEDSVSFVAPRYIKDYETQELAIASFGADEFVMRLEGSKSEGTWYVREIAATYDESRPVEHPVEPEPEPFHLGLTNCWKVSEFDKRETGCSERMADFSAIRFEGDKKTAAWTNGVSVDSFYAYSSTGACTQIRLAATNSSYYGIYSAVTNDSYALALLGVDKVSMNAILSIVFDQERNLSELTVGYDAWQFTVKKPTTLTLSVCAVDELTAADSADWITSDVYTSGVSSVSRMIRFPPKALNKAKYMCFRWSVPNQSGSSMLGITDLRVAAQSRPGGCLLLIR